MGAKTVNGVTTFYLVEDDANPTGYPQVLEEIVNGAVQRVYTYGLQRIGQSQIVNHAWTSSFYGYDGGGSVRQLTNLTGTVTDTYNYDAFGNLLTSTGTTPNNYLYRGEQYDSDLGLYYLRARYCNPQTGRFMSRDPEDGRATYPASLHKYLYANGDPVNLSDPKGRGILEMGELDLGVAMPGIVGLAELAGSGAAQALAVIQLYSGLAYLTAQDIMAEIAAAAWTTGVEKQLVCVAVALSVAEFLEETKFSFEVKWGVGTAFDRVCVEFYKSIPFPY